MPPAMVDEALAYQRDLAVLSPRTGVATFVVTAKEQDDAFAHRMAEDAQEDVRTGLLRVRREPRPCEDGAFVLPDPELEQTATKVPSVLGGADADAFGGQEILEGRHDGPALRC